MSYINSVNVGGSTYNLRDEEAIHDVSNLATKEELNGKLDSGALNNYMTTDQVNNALANKADSSALNDYMTTEQINNALQDKVSAGQLDNFATKEDLTAKVDKNELNNYATKEDLNNVSGGGSNVNISVEGTTLVLMANSGGPGGGSGNEVIMAEFAVSSTTTNDQGHQVVALEGLTNLYNDEQARQNLQSNTFSFKWVDSEGNERGQNGRFNLANSATEELPAGPGNEKMVIDWNAGTLTFINTSLPEGIVKVLLVHHSNGSGSGPNFTDVYTTNITNVSRPDSTKYVYTVEDSAFANMANTISSYARDHWNGAFRDSHGSQWGFGEFSILAAASSADGFDGYKAIYLK